MIRWRELRKNREHLGKNQFFGIWERVCLPPPSANHSHQPAKPRPRRCRRPAVRIPSVSHQDSCHAVSWCATLRTLCVNSRFLQVQVTVVGAWQLPWHSGTMSDRRKCGETHSPPTNFRGVSYFKTTLSPFVCFRYKLHVLQLGLLRLPLGQGLV